MSISHPNDPLHGVTLEKILVTLVEIHGWEALGNRIPIRCFQFDPTVKSSLTFLRKTPWARKKVEEFYLRTKSLLQKPTPPRPLPPGATS